MKPFLSVLFAFFCVISPIITARAQELSTQTDTLASIPQENSKEREYRPSTSLFPLVVVSIRETNKIQPLEPLRIAPLISGGLYAWRAYKGSDQRYKSARDSYFPSLRTHYDDYLQFSTFAVQPAFLLAGIKGQSESLSQAFTADLIGGAIAAGTVLSAKYLIGKMRPDGSSKTSFPSGHTATAFLGAGLFDLEYGHRYPFLAVLHYAAASSVAAGRIINNRHWVSDVAMGAGIGIFSAHLGYLISQHLFDVMPQDRQEKLGTSYRQENKLRLGLFTSATLIPSFKTPQETVSTRSGEVGISIGTLKNFRHYALDVALRTESFSSPRWEQSLYRSTLLADAVYGVHILKILNFSSNLYLRAGVAAMAQPNASSQGVGQLHWWPRLGGAIDIQMQVRGNRSLAFFHRFSIEPGRVLPLPDGSVYRTLKPIWDFGCAYNFHIPL
ncbi:MAG: phosphatase PAP2 family protein [Porphyromonas sp.]|nr:phosphatase PAP2 family protein [Porphyromonas sp.]